MPVGSASPGWQLGLELGQRGVAVLVLPVRQHDDAVAQRVTLGRSDLREFGVGREDRVVERRATLGGRAADGRDELLADLGLQAGHRRVDLAVERHPEQGIRGLHALHELLGALHRVGDLAAIGHRARLVEHDRDRGVLPDLVPHLADPVDHERVGHLDADEIRVRVGAQRGVDGRRQRDAGVGGSQAELQELRLLLLREKVVAEHAGRLDLLVGDPRCAVEDRVRMAGDDGAVLRVDAHQRLAERGAGRLVPGDDIRFVGHDAVEVLGPATGHLVEQPHIGLAGVDLGLLDLGHELATAVRGVDVRDREPGGLAEAGRAHRGDGERARVRFTEVAVAELEATPFGVTGRSPAVGRHREVAEAGPGAIRARGGPAAEGGGTRLPHRDDDGRAGDDGRVGGADRVAALLRAPLVLELAQPRDVAG